MRTINKYVQSWFDFPVSCSAHSQAPVLNSGTTMSNAIPTLTDLPSSFEDRRFFSNEGGPSPELGVMTGTQALEMTAIYIHWKAPQIVAKMEEEEPYAIMSRTLNISVPSLSNSSYTEDTIVLNSLSLPIDWEETVNKFFELRFSRNDLQALAKLHGDRYQQPCAWMFKNALRPPDSEACFQTLHLFATAALLKQLSAILLCAWNSCTDRDDEQQVERLKRVTRFIMDLDRPHLFSAYLDIETRKDAELAADLKSRFVADHQSPSPPSIDEHITNFLTSYPQKSLKFILDDRKMEMDREGALALHLIAQVYFSLLLTNRWLNVFQMHGRCTAVQSRTAFFTSIYTYGRIAFTNEGHIYISDNFFSGDTGATGTSLDPHRRYLKVYAFFILTGLLQRFPWILPDRLDDLRSGFQYTIPQDIVCPSARWDPVAFISRLGMETIAKMVEWGGKWTWIFIRSFEVDGIAGTFCRTGHSR